MSLLRDSAIVGAATFLVGSVLMEINITQEGEPVGWWPYAGTFIAGALGFYLLGATNVVKVKNAESFSAESMCKYCKINDPENCMYFGPTCLDAESFNAEGLLKVGSRIIPYPYGKELIVDEVFRNKDDELCYRGRFKGENRIMELILNPKDEVIEWAKNNYNAESHDFSQKSAESFSADTMDYIILTSVSHGPITSIGDDRDTILALYEKLNEMDEKELLEYFEESNDFKGLSVYLDLYEEKNAESFSADQNEDLSGIKQFMAEVFEADRKARRRTTLTWARGMEQGFIGDDDFLKQPRPYENYDYYGSNYKNSNAYHISGLPTGYHIHLWKPRRRSGYWRVFMKSPNSKVWTQGASNSKSRIMPEVLKWYNDAIAAPTETELTPIQQLMIGQGMISGETQIHRIEIPATIQKKKNKITGEMVSKTIIAGKIQYYYSGGENDSEPTLFATYDGEIEFEINSPPASISNFCRGLIYLDTETAGNLRSVNRYNKDRKQWVASHPAWFQNMCEQGINSVYFSSRRGTYSIEDNEFLRFYGTLSLSETKTLDLGNGVEKPMFQVRLPIEDGEEVVDDGWITPRPSTQKKMYAINPLGLAETKIGIFNKCVAKYQPQEWDSIRWDMLESNLLDNTEGFNLVGSEPAGHIMCRRFKKK